MSCVTKEANGSPHLLPHRLTLGIDLLNGKIHLLCEAFVFSIDTVRDDVKTLIYCLVVPHHTAGGVTDRFHFHLGLALRWSANPRQRRCS